MSYNLSQKSDFTKQIKGKISQISQVQFCSLSAPWACSSRTSVQVDYIFYTFLESSVWLFSTSFIKWTSLIYLISQASNLQKSSTHSTEHAIQAVSIKEEVWCLTLNHILRTRVLMMIMVWTSTRNCRPWWCWWCRWCFTSLFSDRSLRGSREFNQCTGPPPSLKPGWPLLSNWNWDWHCFCHRRCLSYSVLN